MRIDLKSYGSEQELYVDGILVLAGEEMGAHEALEAISDVSKDVEFLEIDPGAGGTMQPFDDRFLVKGSSGSAGGGQRKGSTGG